MKTRGLLLLFILVGQLGCSSDEPRIDSFPDDPTIETLNGTWRVISFEDFEIGKSEERTQENSWGKDIIITFDDTVQPQRLSGKNTTNAIEGEFTYLGERQFRVTHLISTYVGQPQWADKFLEAVGGGEVSFRVTADQLRIYYETGTKSVTLAKD
ncbi:MAG TPA: hypothetical protein VGD65_06800 [Chryseosolibacter sp.]